MTTKTAPNKELLTVQDVAPIVGVSEQRVRQLIRRRLLPSVKVFGGRSVRVPRAALAEWLAVQNDQARASVQPKPLSIDDLFPAGQGGTFDKNLSEILAAIPKQDHAENAKNFRMGLGIRTPAPE